MGSVNYVDLPAPPKAVAGMIDMAASNAAHLARMFKAGTYPGLAGD